MHNAIRFVCFIVAVAVTVGASASQPPFENSDFSGRWLVEFTLAGLGTKHLELNAQANGHGSFLLQEAAPNNEPLSHRFPASWSLAGNERVNFSGEVEMQLRTCCLDTGTLIFKGKFKSANSIAGNAILITSTEDEQNSLGYITTAGAFTATRGSAK